MYGVQQVYKDTVAILVLVETPLQLINTTRRVKNDRVAILVLVETPLQ